MARLLKALPLTLVVAVLSIVTTTCTSTGKAELRMVNALPAATSPIAVQLNGNIVVSSLAFDVVDPTPATPAAYFEVSSGTFTLELFYAGQTKSNPILNSTTGVLDGDYPYTMLFAGPADLPALYVISDDNVPPTVNTVKIRVINASQSSSEQYPGGFDVYILPPGKSISGIPTISGLTLGQAGPGYITLNDLSSYVVWLTPHNSTQPLFNPPASYTQTDQQITTLLIMDEPGGATVSSTMLSLVDYQP